MAKISREQVIDQIRLCFADEGVTFEESMLSAGVMDLGVDSMTYAILVARLERETGFDPFTQNATLPYPETLEDFVQAYVS
jgi:hypothetical protein